MMYNKNTLSKNLAISLGLLAVVALVPTIASAQAAADIKADVKTDAAGAAMNANVKADAKAEVKTKATLARIDNFKKKASQEIDRRVEAIEKLIAQIGAMQRLTAEQKTAINGNLKAQETALIELKTKINAETEVDVLKTDTKAITESYRVFALQIPQGHIIAAADKIASIADTLVTLGTKLQAQVTAAQTAGNDVTAVAKIVADMDTQITDARQKSQEAVNLIAQLVPDQGDKTKMESNRKALLDAQAKLKLAEQAVHAARKDADAIVKGLKTLKMAVKASASVSVTPTPAAKAQ
jgi:hypothetical protein